MELWKQHKSELERSRKQLKTTYKWTALYFEQKTVPNRHDKKPQKKIMHPADPSQGQRKHLGRASAIRTIRQLDGPSSTDQGGWHLPSRRLTPLRQKVQPSNRKWKGKEDAQRSQIRTSRQNTRQQTIYLICGPILAITSTTSRKRDYEYNSSKSYFPPRRLLHHSTTEMARIEKGNLAAT